MAATALLAQLSAWRSVLQGVGPLRVEDEDDEYDHERHDARSPLVLRVDAGRLSRDMNIARLRTVGEALSTLTLLARVDIVAWRSEVSAVWPQFDHKLVAEALYRRWRDMVMGVHFEVADVASLQPLKDLMVLHDGFSKEFRAVLRMQKPVHGEEVSPGEAKSRGLPHPMVPVSLTLVHGDDLAQQGERRHYCGRRNERSSKPDKLLKAMTSVASIQCMNDKYNHRPEMVMKIDSLDVNGDVAVGPTGVQVLAQLVESGIQVRNLPAITRPMEPPPATGYLPETRWAKENEAMKDLACAVRTLLAVPGTTRSSLHHGLRKLTIAESMVSEYPSELLSGLQHSQTVRSVVVKGLPASSYCDSGNYWRWVAFALFSPYATHGVTTLELRLASMKMSDVTAVHRVLAAQNPFATIKKSCDPNIVPRRVQVRNFYICDIGFMDEGYDEEDEEEVDYQPRLLQTGTPVDVLLLDDKIHSGCWLRAHLPGRGEVWVKTADVIEMKNAHDTPRHQSLSKSPGFRTVIIQEMPAQSLRAIVALFRFIGRGIKRLEVHNAAYDRADQDDWIRQLLIECPDLEELKIVSSDIRHLEPIYSTYESGLCRVKRLTISTGREAADIDIMTWSTYESQLRNFWTALSDPSHQMTRHLRELDIDLTIRRESSILSKIEAVINENRSFELLRIHARVSAEMHPTTRRTFKTLFSGGFDGEESMRKQVYRLDLKRKLSFLSVVKRVPEDALGQIDGVVIGTIFKFASDCSVQKMTLSSTQA